MDNQALQHLLTEEEAHQFNQDGFLMVPNALSDEMLDHLNTLADTHYEFAKRHGKVDPTVQYEKIDCIGLDPALLDLIDLPTVFPKVWGILGWNISLFHTHLNITPPHLPEIEKRHNLWHWHQDNGQACLDLQQTTAPRLSLKVGFFLSDLSEPSKGNTYVIPGSHRTTIDLENVKNGVPDNAVALCGKPGTAAIFDQRVVHTASPNRSDITRKILFLGYSYRWLRPLDEMASNHLAEYCDPIRKQLLNMSSPFGENPFADYYYPNEEAVPLLGWLNKHIGRESVQQPIYF